MPSLNGKGRNGAVHKYSRDEEWCIFMRFVVVFGVYVFCLQKERCFMQNKEKCKNFEKS